MTTMNIYTKISRSSPSLKQIRQSKFIGLGIWAIACILIYDRINPRFRTIVEVGRTMGQAASSIFTIEHGVPEVPHRRFDPNQPKLVILLAYQRVGSSFTGQIFNQNPDMFYMFEPVDGIYSAMYGTKEGYTVPSDIAYFWNGTVRNMPSSESLSVAEAVGSILSCDFDNVPTEALMHRYFWLYRGHHKRIEPYVNCYKKHEISITKCKGYIENICPNRFGSDPEKELYCRDIIWNGNKKKILSPEHGKAFQDHETCMKSVRTQLSTCMPLLNSACTASKVRATKTVRLNMETAEYMFSRFSNLRVIHLIRDPRAVALSRMGDATFRAKSSGRSLLKEAQLYCNEVLNDIAVRKQIEYRFPGSVMQVIYEDLVEDSKQQTKALYSFLNETLPEKVEQWVEANSEGAAKNSSAIAERWQNKLTFKVAKEVSDACTDLYDAISYRWPQ